MKDMEREKFEQSWKDALDKAAVSPSDAVWTNIELELEKAKGGELKKRLFFYKTLAAASIVFALAIGGAGYYFNAHPQADERIAKGDGSADASGLTEDVFAPQPENADTKIHGSESTNIRESERLAGVQPLAGVETQNVASEQVAIAEAGHETMDRPGNNAVEKTGSAAFVQQSRAYVSGAPEDQSVPEASLPQRLTDRALPPLYEQREIALVLPVENEKEDVDPVVAMLARLERREMEIRGEKESEKEQESAENFWTSVGFAAGSFNSIASASPGASSARLNSATALAAPIVDQETKASGYSYSMGVNVGTRIADRWVLQGGVNYLMQATEYTANNVVLSSSSSSSYRQSFHPATTNELIKSNELDLGNKIVYSAPYDVNNSMRYISIPMQAGYMLIQKTFGLQLNAGVATDLFLQNTIKANSDQIESTTQGSGADSPYRTVNLSGLLGTEVSYRFSENYRISLNPGIRYPFNTIYKSELGVESTPLTFDVGLRFRYIFH